MFHKQLILLLTASIIYSNVSFDGNQNFSFVDNVSITYISLPTYRKLLGTDCRSGGHLPSKEKRI